MSFAHEWLVLIRPVTEETIRLKSDVITEEDIAMALAKFDPVWGSLNSKEQARVLRLLIERVDYDGKQGSVSVTFKPNGIKALASGINPEETAA